MPIRTDLQIKDGAIHVRDNEQTGPDARRKLPKLEGTDLLSSGEFGKTWQREAGEHSNDAALNALSESQKAISKTFKSYSEIRERQNPEQTQASHLSSMAGDFDKALNGLAKRFDRANDAAKARLASLETEFRDSVKWREQDSSELRAVLRGMAPADRQEIVGNAIESGDGQVLAAVLGAHPTLSGMNSDQQASTRSRAMHKHRPDLRKLELSLQKASELTRQSYLDLLEKSDAITAGDLRREFQKAAFEAAEARKKAAENY